jgi:integrase
LDLIFSNERGRPLDGGRILSDLKAILKDAGLPILRFHDLRHTCATILVALGENVKTVQETLGHSTPAITLQFYQHVRAGRRRRPSPTWRLRSTTRPLRADLTSTNTPGTGAALQQLFLSHQLALHRLTGDRG